MEIPQQIEDAIKLKPTQPSDKVLVVYDENPVDRVLQEAYKQVAVITSDFLLYCLDNEIARLKESGNNYRLKNIGKPKIHRPNVYVAKRLEEGKFQIVNSEETFRELLSSLAPEDMTVEEGYCGKDFSNVICFRAMLPAPYFARVAYVRIQDMPRIYTERNEVIIRRIGYGEKSDSMAICLTMPPMFTDRDCFDVSPSIIQEYNCITIKINNEDHTLRGWIPGMDVNRQPCNSLGENFCLVGLPYPPQKNTAAMSRHKAE